MQAPSFNVSTGELKSKEYQWIRYRGTIDCAIKIYHHEGPYGFFKGCAPNALRVAPVSQRRRRPPPRPLWHRHTAGRT